MADKYDRQIERLMAVPDDRFPAVARKEWMGSRGLFDYPPDCNGCLTMLRDGAVRPATELQEDIAKDTILPDSPEGITKASLPRFAYWQRRLRRKSRKAKT